jgi:thiamine biosynthesis protein ThiI
LLSGGFDSAVAAHLVQQQGTELIGLHFSQEKFVGKQSVEKAQRIARHLKLKKLLVVDVSEILKQFVENCNNRYYFVFMKRLFFRIAEKTAEKEHCVFLVTGENLGQVSSQTLSNIAVVAQATRLPVVRPLLGMEKNEIISWARRIGTHDVSCGPELCDFLGPAKPATRSTVEELEREERKIGLDFLIQAALVKLESLTVFQS